MCRWVFNECELIKLATLNYNLIPLELLSKPLAQDLGLQTSCPNLLGRNAPLSSCLCFPAQLFFVSKMRKRMWPWESLPFKPRPSCGMAATPTALPLESAASICFPVSGCIQSQCLSGTDSELCCRQRRPCLKEEKVLF